MKRYALLFAAAMAALIVSGCASDAKKPDDIATAREAMTVGLLTAFADAAKQPLFELTCPATGCIVSGLKVSNPMAIVALSDAVKVGLTPIPEAPPWWAAPFNTGVQVLGQVLSIKYGLQGIGNIVGNVTGGMLGLGTAGYNAMTAQSTAAFTNYDSSMRAALNGYGLARPNQSVVIQGDGIVASPGGSISKPVAMYQFGADGVVNGGTITKPAARVCTAHPTTGVISCSPG